MRWTDVIIFRISMPRASGPFEEEAAESKH